MGKGGVYGSFVMVKLTKGTAKTFEKTAATDSTEAQKGRVLSPMVYIKEPIAKYFGFAEVTPADMIKASTRHFKQKFNGKELETSSLVNMGSTGKGSSVTVKFTKLVKIGGKSVASVKIAIPSSHTFGNMVQEIMESKTSGDVAAIVSPRGRSMTFKTPYSTKTANRKK
jgi:hypothetical protein